MRWARIAPIPFPVDLWLCEHRGRGDRRLRLHEMLRLDHPRPSNHYAWWLLQYISYFFSQSNPLNFLIKIALYIISSYFVQNLGEPTPLSITYKQEIRSREMKIFRDLVEEMLEIFFS